MGTDFTEKYHCQIFKKVSEFKFSVYPPINPKNTKHQLTITRLTSETALKGIFHQYIIPIISVTIIATVNVTMNAVRSWKPINTNVTAKIEAAEKYISIITIR